MGNRGDGAGWALGQMKVLNPKKQQFRVGNNLIIIDGFEPINTLFAQIKIMFYISHPIQMQLFGNYPFKNGKEQFQLGFGFGLVW